jgi:hypothetical protein
MLPRKKRISNSNSFANFVWQMLLFANSQNVIGREQKQHLQMFGNFDLVKKNYVGSRDQRRSIRLSACYKSTHMQYAKPIPGAHKCQERRRIC